MQVQEAIQVRRSIREFSGKKVEDHDIRKILTAGINAPSGKNKQPWEFLVVQERSKDTLIEMLYEAAEKEPNEPFKKWARYSIQVMNEAPTAILIFNQDGGSLLEGLTPDMRIKECVDLQSIGAAIENMILAATELGLGTLWICDVFIAYQEICKWAGDKSQLVAALSIGYSMEEPPKRKRKSLDDVVTWLK